MLHLPSFDGYGKKKTGIVRPFLAQGLATGAGERIICHRKGSFRWNVAGYVAQENLSPQEHLRLKTGFHPGEAHF